MVIGRSPAGTLVTCSTHVPLTAGGALGCSEGAGVDEEARMTKRASDLVTEAKAQVEALDPSSVERELQSGDAVLVDLREPAELAEHGRIPGSVHVPRGMLEFRADLTSSYHQEPLDPSKRVILHCASGGRSALGAATLRPAPP